ncbi:MAG: 4Fe-4S binding protein [Ignavibacteriales bacterium]|nr:4Fe-4S binding protein [Ignavibacteriales bacterium]
MAHLTTRGAYQNLVERLNRFPQGAPPSDLLYRILQMLFSEEEAQRVALLPIKPFRTDDAARIWMVTAAEARSILDKLADRGLLIDVDQDGESIYSLPPPMAGFFEFSMMRVRNDIDQKALAELFYQYLNVEDDFVTALFATGETQLGRAFVHEPSLTPDLSLHVLDYERASEVIKTASHRAVGVCYCRHKMEHLGKACSAPMNICMTFNDAAESLIKHGIARSVDAEEDLELLNQAYDYNLVQFGENGRERVSFICNCCGCCCEAMLAAKRFGTLHPVHTTNYIPVIDESTCNGCGKCVDVCPVEAMGLVSAGDPNHKKRKRARIDEELCLGCGVCVRSCREESLRLKERAQRVITPLNSTHRAVVMAIERGKLQNLIYDNRALWNHRAMAAILGVILKLPPVKQVMASRQIKSRYMEYLVSRSRYS